MGYQFQTIGLLCFTTPSRSAFITGLVVVLVPLFCIVPALRPPGARMPRWNAFLGAAVALLGIVLLTTPAEAGSLMPDWSAVNRGDLITVGCSVGFALHCLALGRVSPRLDFRPLALLQIGFCAVFMAICLPFLGQPHLHLTPRLIGALLIAAVLATAAAFSIQSWAQSILPPSHTALLITLEPVFAWITSFLVLGERLTRPRRRRSGADPCRDRDNRACAATTPGHGARGLVFCRSLEAQFPHGNLQIGPGFLLLARIAQQKSRVISNDQL